MESTEFQVRVQLQNTGPRTSTLVVSDTSCVEAILLLSKVYKFYAELNTFFPVFFKMQLGISKANWLAKTNE